MFLTKSKYTIIHDQIQLRADVNIFSSGVSAVSHKLQGVSPK